jgi:hypothetical protein
VKELKGTAVSTACQTQKKSSSEYEAAAEELEKIRGELALEKKERI